MTIGCLLCGLQAFVSYVHGKTVLFYYYCSCMASKSFQYFWSQLLIGYRSIGCILYDLVALEHPFQGKTLMGVMYKITEEDPPPWPPSYSAELNELFHQQVFGFHKHQKDSFARTVANILDKCYQRSVFSSCFIQVYFSEELVVTYAINASPF